MCCSISEFGNHIIDTFTPYITHVSTPNLNLTKFYCVQIFLRRDDAQNKMLALKEKADKEIGQYNNDLKEQIRVIDHDRKLKDFMSRKVQERSEAHEEMEAIRRKKEAEKNSEREGTVMVRDVCVCVCIDIVEYV